MRAAWSLRCIKAHGCSPGTTVTLALHCLHSLVCSRPKWTFHQDIQFSDCVRGSARRRQPALRTSTAGASAVLGVSAGGSPPAGVQALTIHWSGRLCTKIPLENVTCIFQLKTIILQYVFPKIKVFWGEKRRLCKDGDTVRNGRVEGCGLVQAPGQSRGEGGHGALAHVWLDGRVLVTGPVTVPVSGSLGRVPSLGFVRSKWLGFSQSRRSVPEERRPLAVLRHRTRSRWALIGPAD